MDSTPTHNTSSLNMTTTALVKGAGPTGLASAAALARLGINVTVVEKRPRRAVGDGRQNVVAIRPEALRNLDSLGALHLLTARGALTDMTWGATTNQWDGSVFDWNPLFQRYPSGQANGGGGGGGEYIVPGKINEQIPSSYVLLGDLEDALLETCEKLGVQVIHQATIKLETSAKDLSGDKDNAETTYIAHVLDQDGKDAAGHENPLAPDLIVCASGKNDTDLMSDLGFRRYIGVKLEEESLPALSTGSDSGTSDTGSDHSSNSDSRALRLGDEGEIESQRYSVFAVRHQKADPAQHRKEATNGAITHIIRKEDTGTPPQPLTEITMSHKDVTHFIVHLPRDLDLDLDLDLEAEDKSSLESYVVDRVNSKLGTHFTSVQDMRDRNTIMVGDPLTPVLVETATAPKYVFGSNVVLAGDAAMSCSPASGIGADIGMTVDSRSIAALGEDLIQAKQNKETKDVYKEWDAALNRFSRRKAEAAVIWSQASRMFYITGKEAGEILRQIESAQSGAGITVA